VKIESSVIALTRVRVIDGTGSPVRENQTIVISGDKIRAIGDSSATTIPSGTKVLELAGF
jgi:imidazolonepropionase-like amidohydrolase